MTTLKQKPVVRRPMPKPPTEARNKPARLNSQAAGFHAKNRKKVARNKK